MSRVPPVKHERARAADSTLNDRAQPGSARDATPVLVVGMHRSGTSALARTLKLMGLNTGDESELLPPHPTDNPTGYWERADVVALHDEFLKSGGYSWNSVGGFDATAMDAEARTALSEGLRNIIAALEHRGRSWFVKDPRLCLLLSQWLPLLNCSACIVVVRDPREIAASILRDELRGAFTAHFLLALWEKYLRTALRDLAGRDVLFVSYDSLLNDPVRECARLSRSLRSLGVDPLVEPRESALRDCLEVRLRRSAAPPHAELSSAQKALYVWLETQCQAPAMIEVRDLPEGEPPDAVLVEYRRVIDYVARDSRDRILGDSVDASARMQEQVSALRREQWEQNAALRQELGGMTEQVSALRKEQWEQNAALRQELGGMTEQVSALRKEQWEQNSAVREDQGRTTEQVSALRHEQWELGKKMLSGLDSLSAEATLRTRLAEMHSELQRAVEQAAAITAERDDLLHQAAERRRLEERVSVIEAELEQVTAHGEAVEGERNALSRRVEQLEAELEAAMRSRARALDAAVKMRRAIDAQLENDKK